MATFSDFGQVYQLPATVTTSYQTSSAFLCGASSVVKLKVNIATDPLSTMTGVTLKVQGVWTALGSDAGDLISYRLDTNTSQPELEHTYSSLIPNNTYNFIVKVLDHSLLKGGLQVLVKASFSSGSAKAGDVITVFAAGW